MFKNKVCALGATSCQRPPRERQLNHEEHDIDELFDMNSNIRVLKSVSMMQAVDSCAACTHFAIIAQSARDVVVSGGTTHGWRFSATRRKHSYPLPQMIPAGQVETRKQRNHVHCRHAV